MVVRCAALVLAVVLTAVCLVKPAVYLSAVWLVKPAVALHVAIPIKTVVEEIHAVVALAVVLSANRKKKTNALP